MRRNRLVEQPLAVGTPWPRIMPVRKRQASCGLAMCAVRAYRVDMSSAQRTVLHVGCGSKTIEHMTLGFKDGSWREVRYDIDPAARPDILGTITDMSGVDSDSVDALYSSHNIEHVHPHEVQGVLREFRRVLKPGGFLVVTCPDLQALAHFIAEGRLEDTLYTTAAGLAITPLDIIYGHIDSVRRGQHYMAHKTGFSRDTLQRHALDAGFAHVAARRLTGRQELWLVAFKEAVDRDTLRETMRVYGPLVSEA
jgi:SAM-dependent methyltransferase